MTDAPPFSGVADAVLVPPVYDDDLEMAASASWQLLSVSLHKASSVGFGIAVSGGRDNPHFTSGDPAVVISDVVPNGPAWGLLQVNDRILSANGVSFESVDYAAAVDIIKNADQINMIVKRRVAMPVMEFEQRTLKFTLSKARKKDDFGIVVGCKFYIKEIRNPKLAEKDPGLREGDSVLKINGQCVEGATLDEVNKWLERSRDKLCLIIQRDVRRGTSRWPSQNTVYERVGSVGATPRHSPSPLHQPLSQRSSHEYINSPRWRDGVLQTDDRRVSSPAVSSTAGAPGGEYEYYNRGAPRPDQNGVRTVNFRKVGGSVGVRVIGGNEVGVFVSAVAADSPAALHGVCCGDRIIEVNGRNMRAVTRESAVQLLLALDDRVSLRLEHARQEFEQVRNNQLGDNFYIRTHFSREKKSSPLEMTINEGDIFHITDTLFGGTVGLWQAARVYSAAQNKGEPMKGVIPNQTTAETVAREQRRIAETKGRGTLLRRKLESRRTKSLPKNMLSDPAELSSTVPLPAYERVALNTPSFHRPLVLFGPLADVARQQLLSQFSMRFAEPESDGGVIRLSAVDAVISAGKHCIIDISVESVERLQLAQYAPIVVLIDVDGRSRIREVRKKLNAPHTSSRKLAEQSTQIKKHHSHLLSATVDASHEEGWFEALRDLVAHLQQRRLWMPEFPPNLPLEDVLLFPVTKANYDSDMDSQKGEYGDYNTRSREDSLPRKQATPTHQPMARSIYDWDASQTSQASQVSSNSPLPPHSEQRLWSTLPRQPAAAALPQRNGSVLPQRNGSVLPQRTATANGHTNPAFRMSAANTVTLPRSPANEQSDCEVSSARMTSPGYYHVKQLLNDESLYQDARLANEIANVRLREEARLREDRLRDDQNGQIGRHPVPLQPPNPDMYSPREEQRPTMNGHHYGSQPPAQHQSRNETGSRPVGRTQSAQPRPMIAPKPSTYNDSVVRNRWGDSGAESPSLASASISLPTTTNGHNGISPSSSSGQSKEVTLAMEPSSSQTDANHLAQPEDTNIHEEEPTVVEETSMAVGAEGAVLRCPNSQVELRIPKGAIKEGEQHEIYVKVCRDGDSAPVDRSKGETLLSPLVMCGPQGLSFESACELRLPHHGNLDSDGQWSFSLKAGEAGQWQHLDLDPSSAGDTQFLSVPITHF